MSDLQYTIPVLPYSLNFRTKKVKASQVREDREKRNGNFRFSSVAEKAGSLCIGDTFLCRIQVNPGADGFSLSRGEKATGGDEILERILNSSLRLSVRAGTGWIGTKGKLSFSHNDLIELDRDPMAPVELLFRDSGAVIGHGEAVLVGGFWGIRMQEFYDSPRMSSGIKGFVETQVFLGSLDLTVREMKTIAEGSILQLDTMPDEPLVLESRDVPLAHGRLQVYTDHKSSFTQTFSRTMTADTPKLFFRVTNKKELSVVNAEAENHRLPGMLMLLDHLSSDRLFAFLETVAPDLSAFVLKCLAAKNPEKTGKLISRLMETAGVEFLEEFILCNPVRAAVHADSIISEALISVCDEREIPDMEEKDLPLFDDPYDPLISAAESILALDLKRQKDILSQLESENPELYKNFQMNFLFIEDLVLLDDRSIQTLLREIDFDLLPGILLRSDVDVREKIFRNISARAANILHEDMDFTPEVSDDVYYDAATKVLNVLRRLIDGGDIVV